MNVRIPVLFLLCASLSLAACSPGERGWSKTKDDYLPLPSAVFGSGPQLGRMTVAPARILTAVPDSFDKNSAEKLITDLFIKDLLSCGRFSSVEYSGNNPAAATLSAVVTRVVVKEERGVHRLREAVVELTLTKSGRVLLKKSYFRTWKDVEAPDYNRAWREVLPPALLEMREDVIAALPS